MLMEILSCFIRIQRLLLETYAYILISWQPKIRNKRTEKEICLTVYQYLTSYKTQWIDWIKNHHIIGTFISHLNGGKTFSIQY